MSNPDLDADRELMIAYLGLCVRRQDWHGVMDAAADLREIDARRSTVFGYYPVPNPAPCPDCGLMRFMDAAGKYRCMNQSCGAYNP